VDGNGQLELAEELIGVRPPRYKGFLERGRIWLGDQEITFLETRYRFALGMAEIPADRRAMGIFPDFSIIENLMAFSHREKHFRWGQFLRLKALYTWSAKLVKQYDIRVDPNQPLQQPADKLSGGNQQKLVAGRELSRQPRVLVAVNPTRGVDILSAARIRAEIVEQKNRGAAILLISTDLDEIIQIADRIAVIVAGQFSGMLTASADREHFGRLMLGASLSHESQTT
jgi:simple sugar transport system ATP-binding protein